MTYMLSGCYIEITFKSRRHLITWSEADQVFLTFNYCVCLEDLVHSVVLFYQGIILKYGIEGTHNQKKKQEVAKIYETSPGTGPNTFNNNIETMRKYIWKTQQLDLRQFNWGIIILLQKGTMFLSETQLHMFFWKPNIRTKHVLGNKSNNFAKQITAYVREWLYIDRR